MAEPSGAGRAEDEAPSDDAALVRRTLAGDPAAFDTLVRRYLRPALAVAWEFTRTRADAEDIVQDAFLRALRSLGRYDPARPFAAWFFTIVRNAARNAAAARGVRDARHADLEAADAGRRESGSGAQREIERAEVRDRLDRAIAALPPMQRACFRLCEAEGFGTAEVAAMLDVAEVTVRVHVHRARKALRVALQPLRDDVRSE